MTERTQMIIARHGNTFGPDDTPTRVGAKTDLPLVAKGRTQAENLGYWLLQNNALPDVVIAGPLKRTREMAEIACLIMGFKDAIRIDERLREIDYGPDENQTEETVIARIGKRAIELWDQSAIVPQGWKVDPERMTHDWQNIADEILQSHSGQTVLIVTSNGVARFAPHLTNDFDSFRENHDLKLSTGAFGIFHHTPSAGWSVTCWNNKPEKIKE